MGSTTGLRTLTLSLALICLAPLGLSAGAQTPSGTPAPPEPTKPGPMRAVLFYLPNRVADILDVFTLGVGLPSIPYVLPASVHANVHATRAVQVGVGSTHGVFLGKDFRRRLSWGIVQDEFSAGPFTVTHLERFQRQGEDSAKVDRVGMLLPTDEPFAKGLSDYWAVGAQAGVLVAAIQVEVHPIEVLDALLGFLFIDISGDDR